MKQFFVMLHHRETVCCLPSYPTRKASGTDICLSVCFTLDCVQFSKTDCASVRFNVDNGNKTSPWFVCISVGLLLPYIPNWDGLSRQMSEPKRTKSKLRQTFQRLSSATEESAKCRPTAHLLEQEICKDRTADRTIFHKLIPVANSQK